ncbi:dihydrolipoyl dehydrogenase [Acuticoccus mangrovi]|uniref:Dihydrolipoyl dehydrogenase n=1 Tax=Acuticoccus mangrovi TaxID=2796142 RepID=A0A934ITI9_9HYPH|nr:dihydrolipoyl dehydrogenase [Acuticoccus mangrovi]MBJ3778343.1 dihydrolipoyl dehydrogenase [Acuticoccus mangrovi]
MDERSAAVAIIGAGTAGLAALREVRRHTDDVLLIEAGAYGTTCARLGCMPSKLMIAAADAAEGCRNAATFGIETGPVMVDGRAVMARVQALRDRFVSHVVESVEDIPAEMRLRGRAVFEGDGRLRVTGEGRTTSVRAERIVIATGSRPMVPEMFAGLENVVTSDDVFGWQTLPESVVVFGNGIIGLELGQALTRLGVRTRLLGKDGLVGPLTDPDVRAVATEIFCNAFEFVPDHEVIDISEADRLTIAYHADGGEFSGNFDMALLAVGRVPNVDDLGLEATSLALDEDGVPLFDPDTGQCGTSAVFIAGDGQNDRPLLHEANHTGSIAGANAAAYPAVAAGHRRTPLAVVFSDPGIAIVGESHDGLMARGADIVCGAADWSKQGRAQVIDAACGRLHVYADRADTRLLGAEMVGPAAEHIAHVLALAIEQRMTLTELTAMPVYHPTLEEGLSTALCDALGQLSLGDPPLRHGLGHGAGG